MDYIQKQINQYLKKNDISPSYQRMRIYKFIKNNDNHPTVEDIYQALKKEMPTLSKTTIYNTLKLFTKKNVIQKIVIEENETRFDAKIFDHGHFKCEQCGKIYDFELGELMIKDNLLKNFKINEQHFYLKGICQYCLNKKAKST